MPSLPILPTDRFVDGDASDATPDASGRGPNGGPEAIRPASVLLVDDHPPNLLALEGLLEPVGVRTVRAASGLAALECLRNEDFAVVLLDVQMPEMDGFQTAARIRTSERAREVPIIFVTAIYSDEAFLAKGYAHGAVDYLSKPLNPDVLRAKVSALADLWRRGEELRRREARMHERERTDLLARERTARHEAETLRASAQAERDVLQAIIQQTGEGVVVADATGVLTIFNPAAERQHGVGRREVGAPAWAETYGLLAMDGRKLPLVDTPLYRALRGESVLDAHWRVRRPDGAVRVLSGTATPLRAPDGSPAGAVLLSRDETERIESSEERDRLRRDAESERTRLQTLLMEAPAAIAITRGRDQVFSLANTRYEQLVGRKDLVGQPGRKAVPDLVSQGLWDLIDGVYATGEVVHGREFAAQLDRRGDGQLDQAYFNFSAQPTHESNGTIDGVLIFAVEVTEQVLARKQEEALAAELKSRAQQLALAADIGTTLTRGDDLHRTLKHCASAIVKHLHVAFARIWTVSADGTMLELQASDGLYTHIDGAHSRVPMGQLKIGRIAQTRTPHVTNDVQRDPMVSDRAWAVREGMVAFAGYPLLVGDRVVGVAAAFAREALTPDAFAALGSIADTLALGIERHRLDGDRARLLDTEQQARAAAEAANRAKDEFLATVSHELRTPLTAMLGWTHMLRTGKLPPEKQARAFETIERNAKAQVALIEDVLDVSRIVTGKLRMNIGAVDLVAVIEAALDTVRPAAEAKNVRLDVELGSEPAAMNGDPNRLQQVVWNLLSNGVKFTPRGGTVSARLVRDETSATIVIADTGPGIPPAFLPHVFERFRQADATSTRAHGGLGLGLAIVKYLVEQHGGTVRAESPGVDQGSTFTVTLPVSPSRISAGPTSTLPASPLGDASKDASPMEGLAILVVDDEDDARELIQSILVDRGATVFSAATVGEALEALRRRRYDVMVSDIGMPDEDGYALIRKVRALPDDEGGRTPAVALTAYARTEDRTRAMASGFNNHVSKPVETAELLAVIAALVGRFSRPD